MEKPNNPEQNPSVRGVGPRHSILDLAPLELECLSALWPMGEGTVREIHRALAKTRPRAYTTVLTIMDRLEQKGIVSRRKVGRAFLYAARLTADEARWKAVEKIVQGFFDGSPEALAAHLSSRSGSLPSPIPPGPAAVDATVTPVTESVPQNLDETLL